MANLESLGIIRPSARTHPVAYVADDVMLAVSAASGCAIDPDAPLIGEAGGSVSGDADPPAGSPQRR